MRRYLLAAGLLAALHGQPAAADDSVAHVVFEPGRFAADDVRGLPKWINFSRDSRLVHVSNGAIVDAASRTIVKWVDATRHFMEVHFADGEPVAAFPRYGVGYAAPAWWVMQDGRGIAADGSRGGHAGAAGDSEHAAAEQE